MKMWSGEVDSYWESILEQSVSCVQVINTSSITRHMSPPLTLLLRNVVRASSMRSNAFAIHRKASLEALGSSLKVFTKPSNVDKLVLDARHSEPERCFPRDFTANKARPASSTRLKRAKKNVKKLPFKDSLPFVPQVFKSSRMFLINSAGEYVSKLEGEAMGSLSVQETVVKGRRTIDNIV